MKPPRLLLLVAPAVIAAGLGGCGDGEAPIVSGQTTPTAIPPKTTTTTPTESPAPAPMRAQPAAPAALVEARSERPRRVIALAPDEFAASGAHSAFALDLARTLGQMQPGNQVVSPTSISIALAMTAAGARGQTEIDMLQALRRPGQADRLQTDMNLLESELGRRGEGKKGAVGEAFALRMANRVWAQRGYSFEAPFLDVLAENYGAGVGLLDFAAATEPARLAINAWVSEKTAKRVDELIPPKVLTEATRMVLTNAVYLDAAWAAPFETAKTANGVFSREDSSTTRVAFMNKRAEQMAAQGDGWVAVSLPFEDQRLAMVIIVPDVGTFAKFEAGLDAVKLGQIVGALSPRDTVVQLPRFRLETAASLKEVLEKMGMARAFNPGLADFSGINGKSAAEKLYVGNVVHKAFIAVSERGTEAAAATAVELGAGAAQPPKVPPLEVTANRPFLFVLRDQPTGAVLFMGRVMDPGLVAGD